MSVNIQTVVCMDMVPSYCIILFDGVWMLLISQKCSSQFVLCPIAVVMCLSC